MILFSTNFDDIPLFRRGKVRDVYDLNESLLFVASDRVSAFDVVMKQPIPHKGSILNNISRFWFENTKHIVPNHLITTDIAHYPPECHKYEKELTDRSMLVKKTKPIMLECIVRGYIAGSGWKEYQQSNAICGIPLPDGLKEFAKLPQPIFTPSTKAEEGHDENINYEKTCEIVGKDITEKISKYSIELYNFAHDHLFKKNIILADTKFEFGLDENNNILLIDEALTPDSSRFWLLNNETSCNKPYNFDKQYLRDWLESINWNKQPPPPDIPSEIIQKTMERYEFAAASIIK